MKDTTQSLTKQLKMLLDKITKYLESFELDELAKATGFIKRRTGKIKPYDFLLSFFYPHRLRNFL